MFLFDFYTIETFSSKISSINLSLFQKNLSKFRSNFSKISSFSSRFFLPKKISSQAAWQDGVFPHIQKVLYFLPDAFFSKFCGPLASLASLPFYLWPARFARKYLTLDQFTSRDVGRIFLGGAVGERSEPTRPIHLRSERSEQAVAGVQGRSPLAGARGRGLGGGG